MFVFYCAFHLSAHWKLILLFFKIVHVYPDIESIDGKLVTFVDGTKETFDMIIYATGYRTSFPMASHLIQV